MFVLAVCIEKVRVDYPIIIYPVTFVIKERERETALICQNQLGFDFIVVNQIWRS